MLTETTMIDLMNDVEEGNFTRSENANDILAKIQLLQAGYIQPHQKKTSINIDLEDIERAQKMSRLIGTNWQNYYRQAAKKQIEKDFELLKA